MRRTKDGKWDSRFKGADARNTEEARGKGCVAAFIVLGLAAYVSIRSCGGHANQPKGSELSSLRPELPHTSTTRVESPSIPIPRSLCGAATAKPTDVSAALWSGYSCKSEDEYDGDWSQCLARPAYAESIGQGCPGTSRCCPPRD